MFKVPEKYRITKGPMKSNSTYENNGGFYIPYKNKTILYAQASDGFGWEHVSVSICSQAKKRKVPNWEQMNYVKDLFWGEEDTVVQFHPKKSEYVNYHPYVLHLWRPVGKNLELPPSILIGPR